MSEVLRWGRSDTRTMMELPAMAQWVGGSIQCSKGSRLRSVHVAVAAGIDLAGDKMSFLRQNSTAGEWPAPFAA